MNIREMKNLVPTYIVLIKSLNHPFKHGLLYRVVIGLLYLNKVIGIYLISY